jgi:hypothetical protein
MRISNQLTDVATMDQHNAVLRVDEPPTLLGQRLGERRGSLRRRRPRVRRRDCKKKREPTLHMQNS